MSMKVLQKNLLLFIFSLGSIFLIINNISCSDKLKDNSPKDSNLINALQSNQYGLVYLALATSAYSDPKNIGNIVDSIKIRLKSFPQIPNPSNFAFSPSAQWNLEWGPSMAPDNSNFVFIVNYGTVDTMYFRAIVLRGTDVSSSDTGLINQLFQDFSAFQQFPWNEFLYDSLKDYNVYNRNINITDTSAHIAFGSAEALRKVLSLTPEFLADSGAIGSGNLIQYLQSVEAENQNIPLIITGHSLGGALTQAVSAFLAWQLGNAYQAGNQPVCSLIIPNAFAPPTVGDSSFVEFYDSIYPNNYYWYNVSDIAPKAYVCVDSVKVLWGAYPDSHSKSGFGASCPDWLVNTIDSLQPLLPNYARPSNNIICFTASYLHNPDTLFINFGAWYTQLIYQHFPHCYYTYLSKMPELAPYNPYKY